MRTFTLPRRLLVTITSLAFVAVGIQSAGCTDDDDSVVDAADAATPGHDSSTPPIGQQDSGTDSSTAEDSSTPEDAATDEDAADAADAAPPSMCSPGGGAEANSDALRNMVMEFMASQADDTMQAVMNNCKISGFADYLFNNDPDPTYADYIGAAGGWYHAFLRCSQPYDQAGTNSLATFDLLYGDSRNDVTSEDFDEFKKAFKFSLLQNNFSEAEATAATDELEAKRTTYVKSAAAGLSHSTCN